MDLHNKCTTQGCSLCSPKAPVRPRRPEVRYLLNEKEINRPKEKMISVPLSTMQEFIAVMICPPCCRVWEDDICSCGAEEVRSKVCALVT